jgi:mRNA-degrading endonuclease RelE of RelBE toxin-antitoxin system
VSRPPAGVGWEIRYTPQAEKGLKDFRGQAERARATILVLRTDPTRGHTLTGALAGCRSLGFKVPGQRATYRAAYVLNPERRRVVVFAVGPHEGFYETAQRRARSSPALQVMLEDD